MGLARIPSFRASRHAIPTSQLGDGTTWQGRVLADRGPGRRDSFCHKHRGAELLANAEATHALFCTCVVFEAAAFRVGISTTKLSNSGSNEVLMIGASGNFADGSYQGGPSLIPFSSACAINRPISSP